MSATRVTGTKDMLLVRTTLTVSVLSNLVVTLRDTDIQFKIFQSCHCCCDGWWWS